jgi:hypothetical protein
MEEQGDDWEVRIDPLSGKGLAARATIMAAISVFVLVMRGATVIFLPVGLWVFLTGLRLPQLVITPHRLTICNWSDRLHRAPGIVRTIGPECRLVLLGHGRMGLLGPNPTALSLAIGGGVVQGWYEQLAISAFRRAGVQVVDDPAAWPAPAGG